MLRTTQSAENPFFSSGDVFLSALMIYQHKYKKSWIKRQWNGAPRHKRSFFLATPTFLCSIRCAVGYTRVENEGSVSTSAPQHVWERNNKKKRAQRTILWFVSVAPRATLSSSNIWPTSQTISTSRAQQSRASQTCLPLQFAQSNLFYRQRARFSVFFFSGRKRVSPYCTTANCSRVFASTWLIYDEVGFERIFLVAYFISFAFFPFTSAMCRRRKTNWPFDFDGQRARVGKESKNQTPNTSVRIQSKRRIGAQQALHNVSKPNLKAKSPSKWLVRDVGGRCIAPDQRTRCLYWSVPTQ